MNDEPRLPSLQLIALQEHWKTDAKREFANRRDEISSSFFSLGRGQSAYHIRGLSEAARDCVVEMLGKARQLPIAPEYYPSTLANAQELLAELALEVRTIAIGANGRMPTPSNGEVADGHAIAARRVIEDEASKWLLEDHLLAPKTTDTNGSMTATVEHPSLNDNATMPKAVFRTGDAGRPTKGRQLYMAEFQRRCLAGSVHDALADEARALLGWFLIEHPTLDQPSSGTIANRIRGPYRDYKNRTHGPTI